MKELITNNSVLKPKVLVCSKCKTPVTYGIRNYYSCKKCDSLTNNVEWKDIIIV